MDDVPLKRYTSISEGKGVQHSINMPLSGTVSKVDASWVICLSNWISYFRCAQKKSLLTRKKLAVFD